jgi:hypothetical protein
MRAQKEQEELEPFDPAAKKYEQKSTYKNPNHSCRAAKSNLLEGARNKNNFEALQLLDRKRQSRTQA